MSTVKHPNEDAAVGYIRVSEVRREEPFSPSSQQLLIEQRAKEDRKRIVAWYDDLDRTAHKANVKRPGYQAAIEDVLSQRARTLYVAKLDRLDRRGMGHVGTLLDRIEEAGGQIIFVADGLDTTRPGAREIIAVLAEQARAESDNTSWRLQQFHAHNRRQGIWKRPPPFGYQVVNGKLRPHPVEAPIVRRMVDQFLDGASLRGIAQRLNEAGVKAPRAVRAAEARAARRLVKEPPTEEWSYVSVREVLIAPSLAAIQGHDRRLFYDDNGELVSVGEGIVTLGERARIVAELERRSARVRSAQDASRVGKRTGSGRPPKHLFSGWIRCGECGAASTWAIAINKEKNKYGRYVCSRQRQGKTCRGCGAQADALEGEVLRRFTLRISTLKPGDPLLERIAERWLKLPDEEIERRVLQQAIDDVEVRLTDLYDARYLRREFPEPADLERYELIRARLLEQRVAARTALDRLGPRTQLDLGALLDTEVTREAWAVASLHRKRSLLQLAIQEVWIYNADRGRVPLVDRVGIIWVGEDPLTPRNTQRSDDGRRLTRLPDTIRAAAKLAAELHA